jgi:hypothetical protein
MIMSGREPRVKMESQTNMALVILQEILMGKDMLDPINPDTAPPRRHDSNKFRGAE